MPRVPLVRTLPMLSKVPRTFGSAFGCFPRHVRIGKVPAELAKFGKLAKFRQNWQSSGRIGKVPAELAKFGKLAKFRQNWQSSGRIGKVPAELAKFGRIGKVPAELAKSGRIGKVRQIGTLAHWGAMMISELQFSPKHLAFLKGLPWNQKWDSQTNYFVTCKVPTWLTESSNHNHDRYNSVGQLSPPPEPNYLKIHPPKNQREQTNKV